jgi:hypothetical protein
MGRNVPHADANHPIEYRLEHRQSRKSRDPEQAMESKPVISAAKAFSYQFSFNTLLALFWAAIYQGVGFSENFFFARGLGSWCSSWPCPSFLS